MDPQGQLQALLAEHKRYFTLQEDGRIKCEVNGHCFPARYEALAAFVNGQKFKKLCTRYDAENSLQKYEPFFIQSKNFPLMLYCALTGQLLEKSVDAIKKHMAGQKFARAQARFAEDKQELIDEPDLVEGDSMDMSGEADGDDDEEMVSSHDRASSGESGESGQGDEGDEEEAEGPSTSGNGDKPSARHAGKAGTAVSMKGGAAPQPSAAKGAAQAAAKGAAKGTAKGTAIGKAKDTAKGKANGKAKSKAKAAEVVRDGHVVHYDSSDGEDGSSDGFDFDAMDEDPKAGPGPSSNKQQQRQQGSGRHAAKQNKQKQAPAAAAKQAKAAAGAAAVHGQPSGKSKGTAEGGKAKQQKQQKRRPEDASGGQQQGVGKKAKNQTSAAKKMRTA